MAPLSWARPLVRLSRRRRAWLALAAALVSVGMAAALLFLGSGDGSGGDPAGNGGAHGTTSTSMVTGGLVIDAPQGWREVPLPSLGFGVALPADWEAVVLTQAALDAMSGAAPVIEGFVASARNAKASGSLLYAAGQAADGSVSDMKVRATLGAWLVDRSALSEEASARARAAGLRVEVDELDGEAPAVRARWTVGGGRDEPTVHGSEVLVGAADGTVWSLVVTSEDDAEAHDRLVAGLHRSFTPAAG